MRPCLLKRQRKWVKMLQETIQHPYSHGGSTKCIQWLQRVKNRETERHREGQRHIMFGEKSGLGSMGGIEGEGMQRQT